MERHLNDDGKATDQERPVSPLRRCLSAGSSKN